MFACNVVVPVSRNSAFSGKSILVLVGFFFEKNPMTNKMKMFLYTLEHLNPSAREKIPTLCLDHPLLKLIDLIESKKYI